MADIDLGGHSWTPVGENTTQCFSGAFDGDGHTISNFNVSSASDVYAGLFGYVNSTGRFQDLNVMNFDVGVSKAGGVFAGGLAGHFAGSEIRNCHVMGSVSASVPDNANAYAGGLVGLQSGGTITHSSAACVVSAESSGNIAYAGGLVGEQTGSAAITYSCATGSVSGNAPSNPASAGGLVGSVSSSGNIEHSCAASNVFSSSGGQADAGGLAGEFTGSGTISNSYAAGSVSAESLINSIYGGGLVGYRYGTGTIAASCVFDAQSTGQTLGVGGDSTTSTMARSNAEMTGASLPSGLTAPPWAAISGYYPRNNALTSAASVLSIVPVKFGNAADTSKSVASPFSVPASTTNNDAVLLECIPPGALTKTTSGSDHLLTPVFSGDIELKASINLVGAGTMTKTFRLRTLYTPPPPPPPPPEPVYGISLGGVAEVHTFPGESAGYGAVTPLEVTVRNTGNQPTGPLSILLSGADGARFTLSPNSLNDIAAGGEDTFSVAPVTSLDVGTYLAAVTVGGGHGITAGFGLSFTVVSADSGVIPVTGLSLSFSSLTLTVGDSHTLDAIVTPDNATSRDIDWEVTANSPLSPDTFPFVLKIEPNNVTVRDRTCKSSNTQALAAAARKLTVTALGPGTAVISAATLDGGFIAECSVAVSPQPPDPMVSPDLPPDPVVSPDLPPDPLISPDLPPDYEVVSPDVVREEPVEVNPETIPPCTLPLEEEGTEHIGESLPKAGTYRPRAEELSVCGAARSFFFEGDSLAAVLELIRMRTGETLPPAAISAEPAKYSDELFSVLLFQQEVLEGPNTGDYVWLVPGVIEPAEAVKRGIVTLSAASGGKGIEVTLKFFVADDRKGAKFLNGALIVGDGEKNGKLTDLIWLNARAPAGGDREIDGRGCRQGRAPEFALGLGAASLLVFFGVRKRKKARNRQACDRQA
jgi:uncharacterized protein YjdB